MGLLIEDLKERRIVRVAARYFLSAVGALCALGILKAWLGMPEWTVRLAAGSAFVMMPFLLVMVWALEDHGPDNPRMMARRR